MLEGFNELAILIGEEVGEREEEAVAEGDEEVVDACDVCVV